MAIMPLGCCNTPDETYRRGAERARSRARMEGNHEKSGKKEREARAEPRVANGGRLLGIREQQADA